MIKYCIHLVKESPITMVEVNGATAEYEPILPSKDEGAKTSYYDLDFVVRDAEGEAKVRVAREHILYVVQNEVIGE